VYNALSKNYFRLLVDCHITDQNREFLSQFDPGEFAQMAREGGFGSAMVYACCHNGNCYYRSSVGYRHANLKGRDIFGETIDCLQKEGIQALGYYTIVFHNKAALSHPEWRMRDCCGKDHDGRYWYACINHPDYIEFVKEQLGEIIAYPIDGIFIDMPFWPLICHCQRCCKKYRDESGCEIPEVIDWNSPSWVRYQRARERWMIETVEILRNHLKKLKESLNVVFNCAPIMHGWSLAQTGRLAQLGDFLSGDFYGGRDQQRLGCKIFSEYSSTTPFEFMTSRCVNLYDHTSTKSESEIESHILTTFSNGGASLLIDAINPNGSLNKSFYRKIKEVECRVRPFRRLVEYHRPRLTGNCGLYFSPICNVSPQVNGTRMKEYSDRESHMDQTNGSSKKLPVVEEVLGTSKILSRLKIPYRIVAETSESLNGLNTLIINNAIFISDAQVRQIREFVREGGVLVATGATSLCKPDGSSNGDFQLADVFGVSFSGIWSDTISYLYQPSDPDNPVSSFGIAPLCKVTSARIEGTVALPYYPPGDPFQYASIHSDPPGIYTDYPALAINKFGRGTCIWIYSSLLKHANFAQEEIGVEIFKKWVKSPFIVTHNLPNSVEVTTLESSTEKAFFICLENFDNECKLSSKNNFYFRANVSENLNICEIKRVSEENSFSIEVHVDGSLTVNFTNPGKLEMFEIFYK